MNVDFAGVHLKNPVLVASGTFGYGSELSQEVDLNALGGVITKGISLRPRPGNPPPRIVETPSGMLNAIGLQNVGLEAFLNEKLPYLRRFDTRVIVNIFGESVDEYRAVASGLAGVAGVDALEVNVSCPNVKSGGIEFGTDVAQLKGLVSVLKGSTDKPLIVKLSPNVGRIADFARAAEDAGADGISLINTVIGMSIDPRTRRPRLANGTGGLSGPAIRPIAVRMVWEAARAVKIPVLGMGGILTADDALEFFLAGASAVAVGTATFVNPRAAPDLVEGLSRFVARENLPHISRLVGGVITGNA
ncbi:MAG: dihydroorotate dehydrogenase [Nitrospirae bacterium]|nr:dihydroorotate dehydrogenase [Nitrospirota bacterium]